MAQIGDLTQYALRTAFRIVSAKRNHYAAHCRGCGAEIPKGCGFEVLVVKQNLAHTTPGYMCPACFLIIRAAHEAEGLPVPDWWSQLDEPVPPHLLQPSPEELDTLIAARERELARKKT